MKLRLHKRALAEIREAAAWYQVRGEGLDRRFLSAIRQSLERIESDPTHFSRLETAPSEMSIQRLLLNDFPYLLIFEKFDREVFVYAVAHASRRPNYWKRRKRSKE